MILPPTSRLVWVGYTLEDERLEPTAITHEKKGKWSEPKPPWGHVPAVHLPGCMLWLRSLEICKSKLLGFRLGYFLDPDLFAAPRCYVLLCRMAAAKMWSSLKGKLASQPSSQHSPWKWMVGSWKGRNFKSHARRWFQLFVISPPTYLGKMNPFWRKYFSNGLVQPLTSHGFSEKAGDFSAKELLVWRVCFWWLYVWWKKESIQIIDMCYFWLFYW